MKNNGRNVSSAIMGRERCGKQMELVLTTRTPPDQLASLDLPTSTKLQIHKHTNTNTKIQIYKYKYTNSNAQIQKYHLTAKRPHLGVMGFGKSLYTIVIPVNNPINRFILIFTMEAE